MSYGSIRVALYLHSTLTPALILLSAVVFYDYTMLTFGGETELTWQGQWRSAFRALHCSSVHHYHGPFSCICRLTEQPTLVGHLINQWCHSLRSFSELRIIAFQVAGGMLMTIRVYALYNQSRTILTLFPIIALGAISISCWTAVCFTSPKLKMSTFLPQSRMIGCPGGLYMTLEQII